MNEEQQSKWQPMMLMIRNGDRIECACGALAIIVIGEVRNGYNTLDNVDCWCQSCFLKEQASLTE